MGLIKSFRELEEECIKNNIGVRLIENDFNFHRIVRYSVYMGRELYQTETDIGEFEGIGNKEIAYRLQGSLEQSMREFEKIRQGLLEGHKTN
jgi:hypothetical protein